MVLSAQMGKAGPPMNGKDLHIGDLGSGILPAAAPLAIGSLTIAGMAMAFARAGSGRVALSFIGEGGSSLGEWHEAINLCAARRLPAVFCLENNQTALSTPVAEQSAVRVFADKAAGYGIPGITIDGTDPDEIAAAFTWAAERARGAAARRSSSWSRCGCAVTRTTTTCSILGKDPQPSWDYPALSDAATRTGPPTPTGRRAIPSRATRSGSRRGIIAAAELEARSARPRRSSKREARAVIDAPWPDAGGAGAGVFAGEPPRRRVEVLEPRCGSRGAEEAVRPRSSARRSTRRARSSRPSCSASAMRCAPIRACSCSARTSAAVRQRLPAAAPAARRVRRPHPQLAARRGRCSASASAPRSPASGRSARCSSTTSWRPASTSW